MTTRDPLPCARLEVTFAGGVPDRTPVLGGWIACPEHIFTLAGATRAEYWADPVGVSIRAYEVLGVDGLIDLFVPKSDADFRCVDSSSYLHADKGISLEQALAWIQGLPEAAEIEAQFDLAAEYGRFRAGLLAMQNRCGKMVWMPAQWSAGARISWYDDLGYEIFFEVIGGYPDHARKLMEVGGARGHCRSRLIAQAVCEGIYPHAVLLGEDICSQRGPMLSPRFMERWYGPQLRHGLAPLLEVGCRPVWHCDGDVRPILDLLLECGIQGFQGFQPECGLTIDFVAHKRTREGQPLVIFGPLSVTTELPCCSPQDIRAKVRHAVQVCRGNARLVLFTANTINPDVPLANVLAMYDAVLRYA